MKLITSTSLIALVTVAVLTSCGASGEASPRPAVTVTVTQTAVAEQLSDSFDDPACFDDSLSEDDWRERCYLPVVDGGFDCSDPGVSQAEWMEYCWEAESQQQRDDGIVTVRDSITQAYDDFFVGDGREIELYCPASPSFTEGSYFFCTAKVPWAYSNGATSVKIEVYVQDNSGSFYWETVEGCGPMSCLWGQG